ncbi:hypothetical protein QUF58_08225 [Anaerolineales bacterium HSG24]|nr:hypothetical protein [Anaerolineales bacterium HSG24]
MYKSQKQEFFHAIITKSSQSLAWVGLTIQITIGVMSSFVSTIGYEDWINSVLKASAILVWSGICCSFFSLYWIDLPEPNQSRKYLVLFILNQLTGCVLLSGLLIVVINVWLDKTGSGLGIALQVIGWILMLFVRPVLLSSIAQEG